MERKDFTISSELGAEYNTVIDLIVGTPSMDNEEKQYWFDILPSMNDSQVERFTEIFEKEKSELQKIDIEYKKDLKKLKNTL